jgi:apolipoprotein N-acyltransferase
VTGVPTGSWETNIFHNSVISAGRSIGFYQKRRLLPFGEYLPLRSFASVLPRLGDHSDGRLHRRRSRSTAAARRGQPVGVSICFEAVFGEDIRLALPEATWLINVSNDAWFKDSTAPHQHLQIARMRALEVGRYLARATNTGVSAMIDQRGRIVPRRAVSGRGHSW